jgi:hypothetical protein
MDDEGTLFRRVMDNFRVKRAPVREGVGGRYRPGPGDLLGDGSFLVRDLPEGWQRLVGPEVVAPGGARLASQAALDCYTGARGLPALRLHWTEMVVQPMKESFTEVILETVDSGPVSEDEASQDWVILEKADSRDEICDEAATLDSEDDEALCILERAEGTPEILEAVEDDVNNCAILEPVGSPASGAGQTSSTTSRSSTESIVSINSSSVSSSNSTGSMSSFCPLAPEGGVPYPGSKEALPGWRGRPLGREAWPVGTPEGARVLSSEQKLDLQLEEGGIGSATRCRTTSLPKKPKKTNKVDERNTHINFDKSRVLVQFVSDFCDQNHGSSVGGREGRSRGTGGDLLMQDRLCRRRGQVGRGGEAPAQSSGQVFRISQPACWLKPSLTEVRRLRRLCDCLAPG